MSTTGGERLRFPEPLGERDRLVVRVAVRNAYTVISPGHSRLGIGIGSIPAAPNREERS